ncbi:hypothetical protein KIF59_21640 [Enterobacter cloacae subsp. cloacae]|nr:hypothetical protein [Enterobacter cloacae subsp. cloacae]
MSKPRHRTKSFACAKGADGQKRDSEDNELAAELSPDLHLAFLTWWLENVGNAPTCYTSRTFYWISRL